MSVRFLWDKKKARNNLRKHGIRFEEASTVFNDPLSMTIDDPLHSYDEDRSVIIGVSQNDQLLIVAHAEYGDTIRIISARRATRKERNHYESTS